MEEQEMQFKFSLQGIENKEWDGNRSLDDEIMQFNLLAICPCFHLVIPVRTVSWILSRNEMSDASRDTMLHKQVSP